MKIIYIEGNLVDATETVILHGCNDRGVMGSGVAKAVKDRYPKAYETYKKQFQNNEAKLGDVILWTNGYDRIVLNGITQAGYGYDGNRYLSYDALYDVLEWSYNFCRDNNFTHIAMPKIGALRGGGNWNIIEKMIEEVFVEKVTPVVYLYKEQ